MNEKFNRLMPESEGRALCYEISKPISIQGYQENFLPYAEKIIETHGEFRLLLYYTDYRGWEEAAAELDLKQYAQWGKHMTKLALVNAPEKEIMARMIRNPLTSAQLRFFSKDRLGEALTWVKS